MIGKKKLKRSFLSFLLVLTLFCADVMPVLAETDETFENTEEQVEETEDFPEETEGTVEESEQKQEIENVENSIMMLAKSGAEEVSKVFIVDDNFKNDEPESNKYQTIQGAIDAIVNLQNGEIDDSDTGYVINVAEGTYGRFLVYHELENIVIQGAGDGTVIETLKGSDMGVGEGQLHNSDSGGIIIWGANITLKDMKITSGTKKNIWYTSAVGTNDIMWGSSDETNTAVILDGCTFEGSGVGYAFMPQRSKFTVNNCTINNYDHAIYFAGDGFETRDCKITNNTIKNCIFAIHGYFGGTAALDQVTPMVISGNKIEGTQDRYSVIAIMDQPGGTADIGSIKLDIQGNTFSYTIVGGINMRQSGDVVQGSMADVRDANTFTDNSYVADAYWYSATDYGTTYYVESPEGKIATWFADPTSEAASSPETLEAIKAALEEHGTAGDVIEISYAEYTQEMFTIAKNALAIDDFVDAGSLKIEKQVEGKENDDTEFYFTVSFTRENGKQLNGVYDVVYSDGTTSTVKLVNGKSQFSLKNGESVTVKDMLPGTKYIVTENVNVDYATEYECAAGKIIANQTQNAKFTNTYETDQVKWEGSKSKTSTNLDENYDAEVTLALPSASYHGNLDVAFVLDGSTSVDAYPLVEQAAELLDELASMENLNVKVSLTVFGGTVPLLENTGLLPVSNEEYLDSLKDKLTDTAYKNKTGRSGSNLQAGIEAARGILNADTEVKAADKYLIVLSDGAARMWYEDIDGDGERDALSQTYEWRVDNSSSIAWNSNGDFDYFRYGDNVTYPDFGTDVWDAGQSRTVIGNYAATEAQKNAATVEDKHIVASYETVINGEYYTTYEAATYYAAVSMVAAEKEANVMLVSYPYNVDHNTQHNIYEYIESFMSWLDDNGVKRYDSADMSVDEVFEDVKQNVLHVVDSGSRVVDVIGYGKDNAGNDYDFAFVNNASNLTLTVGGEALAVTRIDQTTYGFGDANGSKDGTTYPFVLHYYENGGEESSDEHFVWDINVPVTVEKNVQLTYKVHLTNPQTAAGSYGTYDEDGSEAYENLQTNESATLYPIDSDGTEHEPEAFDKPTVSYEVKQKETKPEESTPEDNEPEVYIAPTKNTANPETTPVNIAPTKNIANPETTPVNTGDHAVTELWFVVALVAVAGIVGLICFKKRRS